MKTIRRYFDIILSVALLMATLWLVCSCSGVRYMPVENTAVDSVYINVLQRDSIFVQDSVYVHEKADTVFVTRWHVEYRDALRIDTFYIERVDSVNHIVEIEKRLTKIQQLKMDIGNGVMYAVPIILALYVLYRKMKK